MGGAELIGKEEQEAVSEVIGRGVLFRYGFNEKRKNVFVVQDFESRFCKYMGCSHALGVSSGSAALRVALAALNIRPGDEVITQSFTFVATIEAILESGGVPIITEVDKSLNMDPKDLEAKITGKTKAIIPVHMLGVPARMDEIMGAAKRKNIPVLEDSCQACGSSYRGKKTGTMGAMGTYSFDYVKTLTTGEGGMVSTNDKRLYELACDYHDHGHEHNPEVPRGEDSHKITGFNFRMNEIQGAIGLVQLGRLDFVLAEHRRHKGEIKSAIAKIPGIEFRDLPDPAGDGGDTLAFFLPDAKTAKAFNDCLARQKVDTKILPSAMNWHFAGNWGHMMKEIPPHRTDAWPESEKLLKRAIALPISVRMSDEQKSRVIEAVQKAAKEVL
ncbi:MAG TPA: DegT/DnrJ/EryC1/StrS family aminotransferase [Thermodesulfobacteriota bacterium]|nr:DegT/DnrJ/EryC1/StrS family aminotransferase [Thermodesulfobacteriota bacterium]